MIIRRYFEPPSLLSLDRKHLKKQKRLGDAERFRFYFAVVASDSKVQSCFLITNSRRHLKTDSYEQYSITV
jgi:hypothetical protein